jgi:hypothetical protein
MGCGGVSPGGGVRCVVGCCLGCDPRLCCSSFLLFVRALLCVSVVGRGVGMSSSPFFFTHLPAADPARSRASRAPHVFTDVVLDRSSYFPVQLRQAYRLMRRSGLSTYQARHCLWLAVFAGVSGAKAAEHDVWVR